MKDNALVLDEIKRAFQEDEAEPKESPSLRRSKRTRKKCTEEGKV